MTGPSLVELLARLRSVPDALADPGLSLPALVADTLDSLDPPTDPWSQHPLRWRAPRAAGPRHGVVVGCWLAGLPGLPPQLPQPASEAVLGAITALAELAAVVPPASWLSGDPEREEEAVRTFLRGLGLRSAGETEQVAADRWAAVSSTARQQALRDAARAEALARKLADDAAREAAARATYV